MAERDEEIIFTKMHGIGNDYVYINCLKHIPADLPELSRQMSDRHCGVGGDGIILILPSEIADFKMRIFNADGSEAQMCGNGSRCVAKYVYDKGLTDNTVVTLETLAGIKTLDMHLGADGLVATVTVDMGAPITNPAKVPVVYDKDEMVDAIVATEADGDVHLTAVSMGNPHGVVVVPSLESINFEVTGPELECHPMWPEKANIEFAEIIDRHTVKVRVWERGSAETMACGTGACATAVAVIKLGLCDSPVNVKLRGGDLTIEIADNGHVMMTGPATTVFDGIYYRQ